jgi:hypothetical protein
VQYLIRTSFSITTLKSLPVQQNFASRYGRDWMKGRYGRVGKRDLKVITRFAKTIYYTNNQ